jgi:hypothetical protein
MREPLTALEDRCLRYEAMVTRSPAVGPGRCDLLRSKDGDRWFLPVAPDEAWVAIPSIPSRGGGWYRADRGLDPASRGWDEVAAAEVLAQVRYGQDEVAELTAEMVSSCLADGFGTRAADLAGALTDRGLQMDVNLHR